MSIMANKASQVTSVNISASRSQNKEDPFDKNLNYSRMIKNHANPQRRIYSIDVVKILRDLNSSRDEKLVKLTLVGGSDRSSHLHSSMWDVMFNISNKMDINGCIMLADPNYDPISMGRVISSSPFLDYTKSVSRVHLNKVNINDIVGIGIYDDRSKISYVLLYRVENFCTVSKTDVSKDKEETSLTGTYSGINCQMLHILRIPSTGEVSIWNMAEDEYDAEKAMDFVEHLNDTVIDITQGYPWKPHLIPVVKDVYNKELIDKDLERVKTNLEFSRYEDFENLCRNSYERAYINDKLTFKKESFTKNNKEYVKFDRKLPLVEIYSLDDYIIAVVDKAGGDEFDCIKFHKSNLKGKETKEPYLMGLDLLNVDPMEVSSVVLLNPTEGSDNTALNFYRVLQVNY